VSATATKFKGTSGHEILIWIAEWKKFLVYQGVHHHIILDGTDSQGKSYNPSSKDMNIFEPDLASSWNS